MPKAAVKPAKAASTSAKAKPDLQSVFDALKPIFVRHADKMDVHMDKPGDYYLVSRTLVHNKKPVWFGGLSIKKNYVSFHFVPIYAFPELVETLSPELRKRMQGKGCLNFAAIPSPEIMSELARLTETGAKYFAQKKLPFVR